VAPGPSRPCRTAGPAFLGLGAAHRLGRCFSAWLSPAHVSERGPARFTWTPFGGPPRRRRGGSQRKEERGAGAGRRPPFARQRRRATSATRVEAPGRRRSCRRTRRTARCAARLVDRQVRPPTGLSCSSVMAFVRRSVAIRRTRTARRPVAMSRITLTDQPARTARTGPGVLLAPL